MESISLLTQSRRKYRHEKSFVPGLMFFRNYAQRLRAGLQSDRASGANSFTPLDSKANPQGDSLAA